VANQGDGKWELDNSFYWSLNAETGFLRRQDHLKLPKNISAILQKTSPWPALQRQNTEISKQIFPEKEYRGLSPNFPHSCVCE
jgi:hypothetical protein